MQANEYGELSGKFTIPANVPAGSKTVSFIGKGGTQGSATFVGQGNLTVNTYRSVTNIVMYNVDPLAQTFTLIANTQLAGIDLWFTAKDGQVRVQVREVSNGVPTKVVLGEAVLEPENIVVTGNGSTRVLFPAPISLTANTEYAFVVLCDDPITKLSIAQLGKFDSYLQKWCTAQPYHVGVLLSSSNASTWTPHQDKDLAFRLLEAVFTGTKTIELGEVDLDSSSDLILLALSDTPSSNCHIEYEMDFAGEKRTVSESQAIKLADKFVGKVRVNARLDGDAKSSPVLYPGTQVLAGEVVQNADYYTRSIVASSATKAVLIYDAIIPSGANVVPSIQIDDAEFAALTLQSTMNLGQNKVEYAYEVALSSADLIKAKLELSGTSVARPEVSNIRFMAVII